MAKLLLGRLKWDNFKMQGNKVLGHFVWTVLLTKKVGPDNF